MQYQRSLIESEEQILGATIYLTERLPNYAVRDGHRPTELRLSHDNRFDFLALEAIRNP